MNLFFNPRSALALWFVAGLAVGCSKGESAGGGGGGDDTDTGDTSGDSDTNDTDTATGTASDNDTGTGTELFVDRPDVDDDSDGYSNYDGDCHDLEPLIGPDAMEDLGPDGLGDEVDNDCDGETDEVEACDTELEVGVTPDYLGKTPEDLAVAIDLCDPRFFLGAEKLHSNTQNYDVQFDTLHQMGTFGCFAARSGHHMAALATGPVQQSNANQASPVESPVVAAADPQPAFTGSDPLTPSTAEVADLAQFRVHLKAPANAVGFSFDFLFASAEYAEYLGQGWNDTFYGILQYDSVNGGASTNITFDSNGNEIEVDADFFENTIAPCDERGTGWDPNASGGAGSTGWLRTVWDVAAPRDEFTLTFSIHDEGEDGAVNYGWDSIVLIDHFRWITEEVEVTPGTTIIGIE